MPATYSYPGVYVEEVPSGVHTIAGVSTSNTAFVDFFPRGSTSGAVRITSWGDFEREFGGLDDRSEASYAIQQFYLNGGQIAYVIRVKSGSPQPATLQLNSPGSGPLPSLTIEAANEGIWGRNVQVAAITVIGSDGNPVSDRFNLVVREVRPMANGKVAVLSTETFRNLNLKVGDANSAQEVVNAGSGLVRITDIGLGNFPALADPNATGDGPLHDSAFQPLAGGSDGTAPSGSDLIGDADDKTGIYALDRIAPEVFNILCIPAASNLTSDKSLGGMQTIVANAQAYCEEKRAFFILDIPKTILTGPDMQGFMTALEGAGLRNKNAAVYFPRIEIPDQLRNGRPRNVGASGTLAGIYARTDSTRGIWKAPAGTAATLRNAALAVKLNDLENGALNPLGINVLRNVPVFGTIAWGARTMDGADQQASEWKYTPVRRTALYLEESLFEGLKWVVFEPNDEPLWAQIRMNVGAFMNDLFRQGAFQGNAPDKAYFVKCDSETTTQNDIDKGIVNIWVGFAPLKPAEFVVLKIQQIAGQIET
jgi:phage tail sheath protein FI